MTRAKDMKFLATAVPPLTLATVALRRTGLMRTPQREFLSQCGPWAGPALGIWMVVANAVTIAAPLLLTRQRSIEADLRSTVRPIASLLVVQAALEAGLGAISDKSHPLTGMTFSFYRLAQLGRARKVVALDQAPRVLWVLGVQMWFWRANLIMLLVTIVVRTVMRPRR